MTGIDAATTATGTLLAVGILVVVVAWRQRKIDRIDIRSFVFRP